MNIIQRILPIYTDFRLMSDDDDDSSDGSTEAITYGIAAIVLGAAALCMHWRCRRMDQRRVENQTAPTQPLINPHNNREDT